MSGYKLVMKSQAERDKSDREIDDPGKEIVRLANERMGLNSTLSFSRARDLVLESEPELAKAWLGGEE